MSTKVPDINNVFTQVDAGLHLLSRVKQVSPPKEFFVEKTENMRILHLDGGKFQVIVTQLPDDAGTPENP